MNIKRIIAKKGLIYAGLFCVLVIHGLTGCDCFAGQKDQAKSIETRVGQDISIELEANATTGYQWELATPLDEKILRLVKSEYLPDKTGLVGSGGKQTWVLKALQQGKTPVSFKYSRPWEKNIPPAREESFSIVVKE